jgi:hypothetical protein
MSETPTFFTREHLARVLGLDRRDPILNVVNPLGRVQIGSKTMPIFSAADVAIVGAAQRARQLEVERGNA